jgi:EAL domain-containing protein (putative c-di-GMP-specific phosphodiesterase class I)
LLKKADLALYQAKNAGRNCFHYFTQELDDAAHQRNRDQLALRRATAAKAFYLVYQPVIDAGSGKTTAFEALLRTSAPDLVDYPVSYLIDLAVEMGLISDIGEWVFSQACRQLKQWKMAGLTGVRMAVNTCARELLDPHYVTRIEDCLREYGLGADELEIELTERDAIERVGSAVLDRLSSDGFRLVLDDFGTGYSSLSYLRALPVSAIKLDKSFLIGIPQSDDASAVVRAVITLTHDLKLEVTAEGVESLAQAGFLRDLACTAFQGYLFCTPLNAEAASTWLADNGAPPEQRVH